MVAAGWPLSAGASMVAAGHKFNINSLDALGNSPGVWVARAGQKHAAGAPLLGSGTAGLSASSPVPDTKH